MILVAGASGMLGRVLSTVLAKTHEVLAASRQSCDLSNEASVRAFFGKHPVKAAVHCAGFTDVDGCERDAAKAWLDNAISTKNLARECGLKNIPFIYVSTDYVFSGNAKNAYAENDTTGPVNIYGMTKLAGEYFTQEFAKRSAIVRTSWLFGPGNPKNFVNFIAERVKTQETAGALDDQEDSPTGAADLSEALSKITDFLLKMPADKKIEEVFHFCNSGITTRLEMTREIAVLLGRKNVKISRVNPETITGRAAIRPRFAAMSCGHYEKTFGVRIRPWQEALRDYLAGGNA